MKNRKKIFIIMILFIGLSIASIAFAVSRTSGIFFAKGEKYSAEEIMEQVSFTEQSFDSKVRM